jgi:hypothetical protein
VVHLDKLAEEKKDKGLTVIAITSQSRAAVDAFIEETGAKHPIVIESTDSMGAYGCNSYPSSFLIGPNGKILWTGNPASLSDAKIDEELARIKLLPAFPKTLKAVKKAIDKEKFAAAQTTVTKVLAAGKLEGDDKAAAEQIVEWLDWKANSAIEGAGKDVEAGNFYGAWTTYNDVARSFKGAAIGKRADGLAKDLLADADQKAEIKAGDKFAKLKVKVRGLSPKKALKALAPMAGRKYRDTKAGKDAAALIKKLESAK